MLKFQKRWLLLAVALIAVIYGARSLYLDYRLRSYPTQVIDDIPVPSGVMLTEQSDRVINICRSSRITRYYATNMSWEQVANFYKDYTGTSAWKSIVQDQPYYQQLGAYEKISFQVYQIRNAQDESQQKALLAGRTAYLILVHYNQDMRVYSNVCKPED